MIEAADTGFEQRLIERIALKEAFALRLSARQKRVLRARLEGRSYREIGGGDGCSGSRIQQIEAQALQRLQWAPLGLDDDVPMRASQEPARFDRRAFCDHMARLIERRRETESGLDRNALAELRRLVAEQDETDAKRQQQAQEAEAARQQQMRLIADYDRAQLKRTREESEWARAAAILVRVDIGSAEVQRRMAWFSTMAGIYGWSQALRWAEEHDAQVQATEVRAAA